MSNQQMPKFLRLSQAMHPNNIILKIQLARRDPAIDGLACKGLNLNLGEGDNNQDEDRQQQRRSLVVQDVLGQAANNVSNNLQASIAQHLKDLIYSREWRAVQFEGCAGAERLLVEAPEASARPSIHFLSIRFSPTTHNGENSPRLFERLWKCWHIRKCRLSLEFTNERLEDFASSSSISQLTMLDVTGSTWGQEDSDENENEQSASGSERFENWRKFCQALVTNHPHLKTFELRNRDLSDSLMKCLIDNAVSPHPSIEELHIPGNSCQKETLLSLSEALSSCQNSEHFPSLSSRLRSLTISNDRLSEETVAGLHECCASLHHAKGLTSLTLRDYMIHEEDMIVLVGSLSKMSNIKELSLLSCGLTSQSIRCLCHKGLQRNAIPSLRAISLPEDAKDAMLTALIDNTSIERLLMEGGLLANHKYYMDLNRGGRRLLTQSPSIPNSLWPTVLARAMHHKSLKFYYGGHKRHLDVLYCLVRNKIALEMES